MPFDATLLEPVDEKPSGFDPELLEPAAADFPPDENIAPLLNRVLDSRNRPPDLPVPGLAKQIWQGLTSPITPEGEPWSPANELKEIGNRISKPLPGIHPIQPVEIKHDDGILSSAAKEAYNLAIGIPNFIATPSGLATAATGGSGGTIAKAIPAVFSAQAWQQAGETLLNLIPNWHKLSTPEKTKAIVDVGGNAIFAGLMQKGGTPKVEPFEEPPIAGASLKMPAGAKPISQPEVEATKNAPAAAAVTAPPEQSAPEPAQAPAPAPSAAPAGPAASPEPLGLNRPSVQNPALRRLSDDEFDAEFRAAKSAVNEAEKGMDEGDELTPQRRKAIGAIQDRWEAADLERFRRNVKDTVPEDLFFKLKDMASNAVKFGPESSLHQKARIIMDELARQGATPEQMLAGIKLSSPDAAEVFKADLEDIKKLAQAHGGASEDLTPAQKLVEARNKAEQKRIADEFKAKQGKPAAPAQAGVKSPTGMSPDEYNADVAKNPRHETFVLPGKITGLSVSPGLDASGGKYATPKVNPDTFIVSDGTGSTQKPYKTYPMSKWAEVVGKLSTGRESISWRNYNRGKPTPSPVAPAAKEPAVKTEGKADEDYRMQHRPNSEGPPAHDLLSTDLAPRDIYDRPDFYTGEPGSVGYKESVAALRKIRGKPDATVTVYRASPKNTLNEGDWISFSKAYSKQHGMADDPSSDVPVHAFKVKAKDVRWAGDTLEEFGYYPSKEPAVQTEGKAELSNDDIYTTQVKGRGEMFAVPSPENLKSGKRGFGDGIFSTRAEAEKHIEVTNRINKANAESRAKALADKQAAESAQAVKDAPVNEYLDALGQNPMQRAKLKSVLSAEAAKNASSGKQYLGNRAAIVRQMLQDGYEPRTEEVQAIKEPTRTQFNRMDGKQQADFERRKKEAGTKTEYTLALPDGSNFVVTKAEHDYATWLKSKAQPKPAETTGKAPKINEPFARKGDYEFGLFTGNLPERSDMVSVGMRRAGSTGPFESGGYGNNVSKERIMQRWAEIEAQRGGDIEYLHPKAKEIYEAEAADLAKRTAEKEATEKAKRDADEKKHNDWREYSDAVKAVEIPTGKKTTISVPSKEGPAVSLTGTRYGDWFISKKEGRFENEPYRITHVKSGVGLCGFSSLSQAKDFVRALIHGDVRTDWKTIADIQGDKPAFEKYQQIGKAWQGGGDVPEYFKAKQPAEQPKPGEIGEAQSMGGDVHRDLTTNPSATPTSIKNAVVDQERAKRGLPAAMQPARRSFGAVWDTAMAKIDQDPTVTDRLLASLRDKPRALTDVEDALLLHRQIELQNEYGKTTRELAQAYDDAKEFPNRLDDVSELRNRVAGVSDALLDIYDIGKKSGTETGRGLNARKMMATERYELSQMEVTKRAANDGKPLTDQQRKEIQDLHDRIAKTQKAYDDYTAATNARIADLETKRALDEIYKKANPPVPPHVRLIADKIKNYFDNRADAALKRLQGKSFALSPAVLADLTDLGASRILARTIDFGEWSAEMVQLLGETIKPHLKTVWDASQRAIDRQAGVLGGKDKPAVSRAVKDMNPKEKQAYIGNQIGKKIARGKRNEITNAVQRLARAIVEDGVKDRNELIDRVHSILVEFDPTFTRRETMDAISGYGDFKQLTKDQISVELRDLKGQMQQVAKLEDMQAGQPPLKTGIERRAVSAEESRLIKQVNDAKRKFQIPISDPSTQLRSSLDELKKRMQTRTAELEQKLSDGDFNPRPHKPTIKLDADGLRLKAANERAKQAFEHGLQLDRLKNRTMLEKMQDTFVRWRRGFLLSSPITLAKLTAAAVQRMTFTPIEEAIGSVYSKVIPKVAAKAPREGGFNSSAEAKALTQAITQGMLDSWQTLKTGQSQLDVLFGRGREGYVGEQFVLPRSFADFFGHLHGALKAPVKRAEFARAFEKRAQSAIAAGVDVSDPMVQTRLMVESYKDANRSIFLQDNRVVSAYRRAMTALEQKDKATGRVPVGSKILSTAAKTVFPIVRVPTNIIAETFQYATGTVTGSARLALAMRRGVEQLKPEEADLIMRELKKGSIGVAALLLGYFNPDLIGGYYQQGQKRDPKDVKYGSMRIYGENIPSFLLHNPLLETLQVGATVRRVADSKLHKKDETAQGITAGLMAGGLGLTEEVPFVNDSLELTKMFNPTERGMFADEYAKSLVVPQLSQFIANQQDKDAQGNIIKRDPKTLGQHIETGIPYLRERVPAKVVKLTNPTSRPDRPPTPRP
jgi:hypothetical protein